METSCCSRAHSERRQCSSCVATPRNLLSAKSFNFIMDWTFSCSTSNLFTLSLLQTVSYAICCKTAILVDMIPRNMLNERMKSVNGINEDGLAVT